MDLECLRKQIEDKDKEIISLFFERLKICENIAEYKKTNGIQIRDVEREKLLLEKLKEEYGENNVGELYETVIRLSREHQHRINEDKNIVLIGMPGCGKSTVGKRIAEKSGLEFYDTDIVSEQICNRRPAEIIREFGEEKFRNIESSAIAKVTEKYGCVISTGGGSIVRQENIKLLKKHSVIVFIDCPVEKLSRRDRPLSQGKTLYEIYKTRLPVYRKIADVICKRGSDADETCKLIIDKLKEEGLI